LGNILSAQQGYSHLLDIEYYFILGRKNKTVELTIEFTKTNFYHIAGLQHLKDLPRLTASTEMIYDQLQTGIVTQEYIESSQYYNNIQLRIDYLIFLEQIFDSNETIFKYNPKLQAFSVIEADFLLKNSINKTSVYAFLSKGQNGKYFCKSFFPDNKKDYTAGQTRWTVLYKKKMNKLSKTEIILYQHPSFYLS
jgi:hypothetical protein